MKMKKRLLRISAMISIIVISSFVWAFCATANIVEVSTYDELKTAITNSEGAMLIADIVVPEDGPCMKIRKSFTLDLNGHSITKSTTRETGGARTLFQVEDRNFSVCNSSSTQGSLNVIGNGKYTAGRVIAVNALKDVIAEIGCSVCPMVDIGKGVRLHVEGSATKSDGSTFGTCRALGVWTDDLYVDETGKPVDPESVPEIYKNSQAYAHIEEGAVLESDTNAISADGYETSVSIKGGTITGKRNAVSVNQGGTVGIKGGTFKGGNHAISNDKGLVDVSDGVFSSDSGEVVYNNNDEKKEYPLCKIKTETYLLGGKFTGKLICDEGTTLLISKGQYTVDPSKYLTDKKILTVTKNDIWYIVATITDKKNLVLQASDPQVVTTKQPKGVESVEAQKLEMYVIDSCIDLMGLAGTVGLPDTSKINVLTGLVIRVNHSEGSTGTIGFKVTLSNGITIPEGEQLYILIPIKGEEFGVLSEKVKAIAANYVSATKELSFEVENYEKSFSKSNILVVSAKEQTQPQPSVDSNGGGGCNAGFGALALLLAIPIFKRNKD